MRSKHILLLLIVPLSEIKALFYNSDLKVYTSFFSAEKRYLCNVLEDYSNILIFGIILFNLTLKQTDKTTIKIAKFLFILNFLDLIHLGLLDMQYLIFIKIIITYILCKILKIF